MIIYFRTRHTLLVVIATLVVSAAFLLFNQTMGVFHDYQSVITCTPATPLQLLVVIICTLGLSGRMEQFEFAGTQSLVRMRLLNVCILLAVGLVAAALIATATLLSGVDAGSVSLFGPARAFVGLFGISLAGVAFTDMRVGALFPIPFVFLPAAFNLQPTAAGQALGFVLADGGSLPAWCAAIGLFVLGTALYGFRYSERNSPSSNRRALIDSRPGKQRSKSYSA